MGSLRSLRRRQIEPVPPPPIPSDEELIDALEWCDPAKQVKNVLERGVNPNAIDRFGRSALSIATELRMVGLVRLLVGYGADVNHSDPRGYTALHRAGRAGKRLSPAITQILLDHGADINAVTNDGWTPLMIATRFVNFDTARILIERGADATIKHTAGKRAIDMVGSGTESESLRKLLKQVS